MVWRLVVSGAAAVAAVHEMQAELAAHQRKRWSVARHRVSDGASA